MWTVAIYEIDRAYGGPEEGGWWYDCGSKVTRMRERTFDTREDALECMRRLNGWLHRMQEVNPYLRSVGSVAYDGGRYRARAYEGSAPSFYPNARPYYC